MHTIQKFIDGFLEFQEQHFKHGESSFTNLKYGQEPQTMVIGCSDSRVDPALLMGCEPGDIFVSRNVANLIPPYEDDAGLHGVSAALEFAVCNLKVQSIIILGHSFCGGIKTLMRDDFNPNAKGFLAPWISLALPAKLEVLQKLPNSSSKTRQRAAEQYSIILSLKNLMSFPFIKDAIEKGTLSLFGWYFDIENGELFEYNKDDGIFKKITNNKKEHAARFSKNKAKGNVDFGIYE
ncbi:carbonic anhydrase [Desulfovibrio litoralis]|uniref:Carbonic anhydrase n=1 Tax=Desulfovibrio litoralis DSM 11393 TaxID=1121455 RepID=A0A1M7SRW8_9BACT|nr:carbonic anhydrase [Desulfovibrio litoralis]SHN61144.1 carbonic anhydrase [Desulfovibrio litoralis DSM 11393]